MPRRSKFAIFDGKVTKKFIVQSSKLKFFCIFANGTTINDMNVQIEPTWKEQLQGEFDKPYFQHLTGVVRQEYQSTTSENAAKVQQSIHEIEMLKQIYENKFTMNQ